MTEQCGHVQRGGFGAPPEQCEEDALPGVTWCSLHAGEDWDPCEWGRDDREAVPDAMEEVR